MSRMNVERAAKNATRDDPRGSNSILTAYTPTKYMDRWTQPSTMHGHAGALSKNQGQRV